MKYITMFLVYLLTFFGGYFLLSLFGMVWVSYHTVISDRAWFGIYFLFLGWWIAEFPAYEYYMNNEDYFDNH